MTEVTIDVLTIGQNGQVTVPVEFRKEVSLAKGGKLVSLRMGDALVLVPQDSLLESISLRLQEAMKASGVTLEDLKSGVQEQRAQIVKERYAHLRKPVKSKSKVK
jgi:bifunctional DNA-binding transcriptional regulator/antitoxin component of YhaV-PrlF toxin-antitoxin module